MKQFVLVGLVGILLAASCRQEDMSIEKYVASYKVNAEKNAMRANIGVQLKKDCKWAIKYWADGDEESSAKQTRFHESSDDSILLLFLKENTEYSFKIVVKGVGETEKYQFRTIERPEDLYDFRVKEQYDGDSWSEGYILQSDGQSGWFTFCDYNGKIVWYEKNCKSTGLAYYNPKTGLIATNGVPLESNDRIKHARIMDLDGNILQDLSSSDFGDNIHHEVRPLDEGTTLVLGKREMVIDGISYWGDRISEVDLTGNILFDWDTNTDYTPASLPFLGNEPAKKDYLHVNSVEKDKNGDYYITINYLNELAKIDGKTGKLIYRLGEHGNVTMIDKTPEVFHSTTKPTEFLCGGIHAAFALEPDRILCYGNGNDNGYSKAAIIKIDPENKTAEYQLLVDVEKRFQCPDRSSANLMPDSKILFECTPLNLVVITDYEGNTLRVIERQTFSYRALWYSEDDFDM